MNQYKWLPTTCAPECYPAKLMNGAFDLSADEPPVFIPRGNVCNNGWGETGLINLTETELFSLPSKFDLTWFSFTEDLFYNGRKKQQRYLKKVLNTRILMKRLLMNFW